MVRVRVLDEHTVTLCDVELRYPSVWMPGQIIDVDAIRRKGVPQAVTDACMALVVKVIHHKRFDDDGSLETHDITLVVRPLD